jgi:hypothetical protein
MEAYQDAINAGVRFEALPCESPPTAGLAARALATYWTANF